MHRVNVFGRSKLNREKDILQNVSSKAIDQCSKSRRGFFCNYYRKGELEFLRGMRKIQQYKSLKILKSRQYTMV